jgi:hypothetical protein
LSGRAARCRRHEGCWQTSRRLYVPPDGDSSGSTLLAANNIGHVTLGDGKVTHRLIARTRAGTRVHEATMATGDDVLAAHNGRGVRA